MVGDEYDKIDYTGSIAIVIGNEGAGMSELTRKNCDFIASIPMRGLTNSLNASVACGIVVFEALNCRSKNGL
jgi:23S rRNA (guanosine2251-2'-O)-methyltransferase